MIQATPTTCAPTDPQGQLKGLKVTLRSDLRTSRQVYQGTPVYVVHDPVGFRTHRLTVFQYRCLATLDSEHTLGENFVSQLAKAEFVADEEDLFLDLVMSFSRLGLVLLPINNGTKLFEQHKKMQSMKRRGKAMGFLFMQIPLVNPDRFLSRTMHRMSWPFTRTFFVAWLIGMAAAAFVVCSRFTELVQPLNGILATKNLPFLWLAFVGLKIWHELGHGYACKVFGGFIPEMGTILIAGTPAAYVDASAAWSFPERYKRLIVMCGGMFFESLVFIPGVFIWAFSSSAMLSSCAYQLVVMASVVTVLFNANPLMKFDGYFILSELISIQNLRPRADQQIKGMLVSTFLGVKLQRSESSLRKTSLLILYGVAATIYKFSLVISIAVMVAMKFPMVGLGLAAFHISTTLGMGVSKMASYLLRSKETEPVRGRARIVAAAVLVGLPVAACFIPVPFGVVTQGLVGAEVEHFINVSSPGEFQSTLVKDGQQVSASAPLVQLRNDRLEEQLQLSRVNLQEAMLRSEILKNVDMVSATQQQATVTELQQEVDEIARRVGMLTIPSPDSGTVVQLIGETNRGRFLDEGTPLAIIIDGKPRLRTWLNEEQLGSIEKRINTEVRFRIPGQSMETHTGRIVSIEPAAELIFDKVALTYIAGGEILINPSTGRPMEPVFQVDIEPSDSVLRLVGHGARVNLQLPRRYESIAAWTYRKCMRFIHKLLVA